MVSQTRISVSGQLTPDDRNVTPSRFADRWQRFSMIFYVHFYHFYPKTEKTGSSETRLHDVTFQTSVNDHSHCHWNLWFQTLDNYSFKSLSHVHPPLYPLATNHDYGPEKPQIFIRHDADVCKHVFLVFKHGSDMGTVMETGWHAAMRFCHLHTPK